MSVSISEQQDGTSYLSKILFCQLTFGHDHVQRKEQNNKTVPNVTEHDGEQEWESDDCEQSRVDFLVTCNTVTVHDRLETLGEFIGPVERGRGLVGAKLMQDWRYAGPRLFLENV